LVAGSQGNDEECPLQLKKTKRENAIEQHLQTLREKHSDKWPEFKLRAWATMVVSLSSFHITCQCFFMMLCRKHYDIETIALDTNYKPCIN
jgi:hypothetical protein